MYGASLRKPMRGDREDRVRTGECRTERLPSAREGIVLDPIHRGSVTDKERGHARGPRIFRHEGEECVDGHVASFSFASVRLSIVRGDLGITSSKCV